MLAIADRRGDADGHIHRAEMGMQKDGTTTTTASTPSTTATAITNDGDP